MKKGVKYSFENGNKWSISKVNKEKVHFISIVKILQGDRFWTALQVSNIVKKG